MLNLALGPVMLDLEGQQLLPYEIERLQHPAVGGVILFARNFENKAQLTALVEEICALRHPQLLIAVDQEGGRVQRFKEGFHCLPPMACLGQLYESDPTAAKQAAESIGRVMASELVACGVDFSFAPVLDLAAAPSAVIGDRAFASDPMTITTLASALIGGMNSAGMQATGKHFPGHGHVCEDSHHETPVDERSLSDISAHDLVPFRALAGQLGAVMTAHIHYPEVDENLPTFSPFWIKQVLREQLGFKGVVFSDDLTMHGALVVGDIQQRVKKALAAGCDMVLVCNDPDAAERALSVCQEPLSDEAHQGLLAMQSTPPNRHHLSTLWDADINAIKSLT